MRVASVGKSCFYWPEGAAGACYAATIASVDDDGLLNVGYLDEDGDHYSAQAVELVAAEGGPVETECCTWHATEL